MTKRRRILWPIAAGLAGSMALTLLYFGIVSWAESPGHALELFWEDRFIVLPIILGFGVQAALYTVLKKRLFLPVADAGPSGMLSFPAGVEGSDLLAGASQLTLSLRDVDAAERAFTWNVK